MELNQLKPRKTLNKAFLKVKPNRTEIEGFKANLITLLDRTNDTESEEFHKNLISDFLKDTYYKQNHFINTKGRNDLVIHNGNNASTSVGVILEAKKPTNKSEMMSTRKLNTKAFQELVLYYLRERITHKNLEVKHLVATNINEWFIFDATLFDRLFAQNKNLVKQFQDFEGGRMADTKTDFFYKQIAEPFIESISAEIEFTYFNIQDYQNPLRNADKADDNKLIALFKLLSPEHLLKLPFTNDSNSLDKRFYTELLHIIGLTETKEGGKKLIQRNEEGKRNTGSILEDAIIQLDSLDKLSRLDKPSQYGATAQERLFNVGLELSITWINRILFLKLLEAQLITYHKGDKSYSFLNLDKIKNYDDLNSLFFQVLARKYEERNSDVKKTFEKVPYLNSSLFEPTDMEQLTLFISNLKDEKTIPIHVQTVLKDQQGKKRSGNITTLEYLFEFLNAYDFSSEGSEDIQEDNKTLINASVLGLIFEKINGYKDGSFFTPGFITMYMCRETIRKAVVQKFNEAAEKNSPLNPLSKSGVDQKNQHQDVLGKSEGVEGVNTPLNPLSRGDLNTPLNPLSRGDLKTEPLEEGPGGVSLPLSTRPPRRVIIPYNPKLKAYARELRNNSTKSEILLWKNLKGKFDGKYDFHRQKPLDHFIADFFCYELKLVIEVDGGYHALEETQVKDKIKEERFNDLGLNVLRIENSQILEHLEWVIDIIREYIKGYEQGDLSAFKIEESLLNPLTGRDFVVNKSEGVNTPLNPLSRGDLKTVPLEGDQSDTSALERTPAVSPSRERDPAVSPPLERGPGGVSHPHPHFSSLDDVYDQIGRGGMFTRQEANQIVNSIKICDPAVGSGHFLVSALNEMIAVKNDLKILQDRDGKRLKEYQVEVVNDELIVTDEEGELFEYNPNNRESQRIQETLFHEKQTIIENCLFGVDINTNSVKICRLRLWIELLKSAYYVTPTPAVSLAPERGPAVTPPLERGLGGVSHPALETLPNIDINIKCGNSLVSRFAIDADLKQALKKSKWTIDSYKLAVATYRNAESKEQKREMERLIADIKGNFRSEIERNDPLLQKKAKLGGELYNLTMTASLFEPTEKEKKDREIRVSKINQELEKIESSLKEIQENKIFENAFEWRFEFPEVLNDDGDFVGFDVVFGNPPYMSSKDFDKNFMKFLSENYITSQYQLDLYVSFMERGITILKPSFFISFITPNSWLKNMTFSNCREYLLGAINFQIIFPNLPNVFDEASVDAMIFVGKKESSNSNTGIFEFKDQRAKLKHTVNQDRFQSNKRFVFDVETHDALHSILEKIKIKSLKLEDVCEITRGVNPYDKYRGQSEEIIKSKAYHANFKKDDTFIPEIRGKHVSSYSYNWDGNHFISYGEWLAAPRDLKFFHGPRLIMRQVLGTKLNCTVIYEDIIIDQSIFIAKPQTENEKYLNTMLGVLASKLASWYFRITSNEFDALFPKIKIGEFRELPIPIDLLSSYKTLDFKVNEILKIKKQNPLIDTSGLESHIDQLVYELYGLTEEEISIVEGK